MSTIIVQNKREIAIWLESYFEVDFGYASEQKQGAVQNSLPLEFLPNHEYEGELIFKPNFIVYYDETIRNARYTFHSLEANFTKGAASRAGMRFNEVEKIASNTAAYQDFSHTGYDRGHLVPAGDFQCCQAFLEQTFAMSNIAPFDSVLNRHAWNELEIQTRKWARKYGKVFVLTGGVFEGETEIGKYNSVQVPSHFFKVIVIPTNEGKEIERLTAFLMPNKPLYSFDKYQYGVSIDQLEAISGLNFFPNLNSQKEIELESVVDVFK